MTAMSDFLEDAMINLLRGTAITPPANWYLALYTDATDDAAGGTEVSGGSYARAQIPAAAGSFDAPAGTGGDTENTIQIVFPTATADWGAISHWALYDAAVAGNRWFRGAFTVPKTVLTGIRPVIDPGELDFIFA